MANETVTKVVQGVDKLFDEIVVNGRTVKSRAPSTHTAQSTPAPRAEPVEGQYVGAVQLNDVIHGLKDVPLTQRVSSLENGVRSINELIPSSASSANKLTDKSYVDSADSGLQTDITNIGAEVTALQTLLGTIQQRLTELNAMIPNQASAQNQLADKDFVNSSISTNTANFLGTYSTLAEIEAIQNPTNNDYAFLETTDASGNTVFDRYKYSGADSQWLFEYELNNSSFTAEQWATINSGLTQSSIDSDIASAISDEVADRNTAITNAITSLLAKIATQFSTSAVYAKDTYVSYEGSIYRCINNHPAGAWVAGDFTEVNLANDLMQIIKSMSGGGSSIDMNEIAELFNINKNVSNIEVPEFQGALVGVSSMLLDTANSYSKRSGDLVVYSDSNGNIKLIIDLKDCIVYHTYKSQYAVTDSKFVFDQIRNSYTYIYKIFYNDIMGLGEPYMYNTNNKRYIGTDGIKNIYFIVNNYVYSINVYSNNEPVQKMSGNGIVKAKEILLITSANGIYTSDTLLNKSPVRVFTSASSYPCFGKNKFAVLVGSTVYYSEDTINWNATSMIGVSELYFSCGKFVARKSSGDIYYSDDLSEWKLSVITTTTGTFTDTVFVWGNYYTRDFEVVASLQETNYYAWDKNFWTIGNYTYKVESNNLYKKSKYADNTQYERVASNVDYNTVYAGNKFMVCISSYNYLIASPLYECGGNWCRMSLN